VDTGLGEAHFCLLESGEESAVEDDPVAPAVAESATWADQLDPLDDHQPGAAFSVPCPAAAVQTEVQTEVQPVETAQPVSAPQPVFQTQVPQPTPQPMLGPESKAKTKGGQVTVPVKQPPAKATRPPPASDPQSAAVPSAKEVQTKAMPQQQAQPMLQPAVVPGQPPAKASTVGQPPSLGPQRGTPAGAGTCSCPWWPLVRSPGR